ncbi:MAG TPA: hypothetical protein VHM24_13610, partial [Gemmatimonadaceae bacterium]|nr:hypothetical protein [Gemmatimonadaceae bacterium]
LPQALLGYNGCVRGSNTPDCFRYPKKVYGQARKSDDSGFRITGSRERTAPRSSGVPGVHRP